MARFADPYYSAESPAGERIGPLAGLCVVGRSPIARGTFSRTIRLPEDLDFENAKADFKDGILEIHLPKTHRTERRQIKVD